MPKDKRHAFASAQVGEPVPGKDAFNADDQIGAVGRNGFEKRFRASRHVPMHEDLTILVQNTEVHGTSM
jgi:hypothetical protein